MDGAGTEYYPDGQSTGKVTRAVYDSEPFVVAVLHTGATLRHYYLNEVFMSECRRAPVIPVVVPVAADVNEIKSAPKVQALDMGNRPQIVASLPDAPSLARDASAAELKAAL